MTEVRQTEDATQLVLKTEEEAPRQGMQVVSRSWSRQGNGFSPKAFRKNVALVIP